MVTGPYAVQFCGVGPMSLAQGYGSGHTERRRAGRGGRLPRGPVAFPNPVEVAGEDLLEFPRAGGDVVPSRVLERLRVLLAKQIEEGPARPRRDLLIRCPIHVEGREAEISLADARREAIIPREEASDLKSCCRSSNKSSVENLRKRLTSALSLAAFEDWQHALVHHQKLQLKP